jgi:hypothetical protein
MAVSIARHLMDEASSGTTPTECADDANSNTLTIDYSSGDAAWTSIGAGNGLDYTATVLTANTATAELSDISTNGNIGSSFSSGTQQLSYIIVCDIDVGNNSGPRLVQIGSDSGDGDFAIATRVSDWLFRWSKESGGSDVTYPIPSGSYGTGVVVVAVVIDSTEGTAANRIKVYYDNVLQTATSGTIALNESIDLDNTSYNFSLGNRGSLNRNINGKIYYSELFTGALTATEVEDAYDALILDNDANWQGGAVSVPLTGQGSTSGQGTITVTGAASVALAGQSSTGGQGAVVATGNTAVTLTGQESTSGIGSIVVTVGGVAVVPLTGQQSTSGQGVLSVAGAASLTLTGQGSTTAQGALSVSAGASFALAGQASTAGIGTVTTLINTVVSLTGQGSASGQGTIGLQTANILTLTGQESSSAQGLITISGGGWTIQPDISSAWDEKIDSSTTWVIQ